LQQVADLMIRNPKLSKTAAIKHVTGRPDDETSIRRLRDKLTPELEQHLAAAQARAAQRTHGAHADWRLIITNLQAFGALYHDAMARVATSDTFRHLVRTVQEIEQSEFFKVLREFQNAVGRSGMEQRLALEWLGQLGQRRSPY